MTSQLTIYLFVPLPKIAQSINSLLSGERYNTVEIKTPQELKNLVQENKESIDCLIILNQSPSLNIMNYFYEQGILLPVIIIESEELPDESNSLGNEIKENYAKYMYFDSARYVYHSAEIKLKSRELGDLSHIIDKAISQYLYLGPSCSLSDKPTAETVIDKVTGRQSFLLLQQRRLAEKLKERLGYLGVYYNRNANFFYRHLSQEEKDELLQGLTLEYKVIILSYFDKEKDINQDIDQFVNRIFFSDLSVSQVLEIHMELMDTFAQKLKLEGRSDEILLDYRLVLIDIIAHLCEMYRRSIPREDLPFDVLFPVD